MILIYGAPFRYRHVRSINWHRLGLAALLLGLYPVALELSALVMLALLNLLLWTMIAYEIPGLRRGPRRGPPRGRRARDLNGLIEPVAG